ncbi:MAG: hypothetical protein L0Z62_37180 [Gemmataceae bacterium]|nr:hypothetical protein [Gemmataceae bacterium]
MSRKEQIEQLLQVLKEGTAERTLQWQTTADETAFRLASKTANVRLVKAERFDQEEQEAYWDRALSVLNDKGRVIEVYSPTSIVECQEFDELFDMARRSAYKTEEVLDKLLDELRATGQSRFAPVPKPPVLPSQGKG